MLKVQKTRPKNKKKLIRKGLTSQKKKSKDKHDFQSLVPGDIIDIVAPGSYCTKEVLEKSIQWLKAQGFQARIPDALIEPQIYLSNTDQQRFYHFKQALFAEDSKAIWCLRGGYGSLRLLPELQKIKKLPFKKWFLGYSDITTIHQWLNQNHGWTTLHSPLFDRAGLGAFQEVEKNEVIGLISGQKKEIHFSHLKPFNTMAQNFCDKNKKIKSKILGGNLTVFTSSLGTFLDPKKFIEKNKPLLFFEDIGERGYRLDRLLHQCLLSGVFQNASAVVLGDFLGGSETNGENHVLTVLRDFFEQLSVPVFSGLPVGHGGLQRVLPLNAQTYLTCAKETSLIVSV